jgi:hypothetical protein
MALSLDEESSPATTAVASPTTKKKNRKKIVIVTLLSLIAIVFLPFNYTRKYTASLNDVYNNNSNVYVASIRNNSSNSDDDKTTFYAPNLGRRRRSPHEEEKNDDDDTNQVVNDLTEEAGDASSNDDQHVQSPRDYKYHIIDDIRKQQIERLIKKNSNHHHVPIYLIKTRDDNNNYNAIAQTSWDTLARQWNRTTMYDDLFTSANPRMNTSLINITRYNHNNNNNRRMVVIIHCGPKTGSTTLRYACQNNMKETCTTLQHNFSKRRAPKGYFSATELYEVIQHCNETSYFCFKGDSQIQQFPSSHPPSVDDDNTDDDDDNNSTIFTTSSSSSSINNHITYVHMFPFRNYNDWAQSAMKQQYDRSYYEQQHVLRHKNSSNNNSSSMIVVNQVEEPKGCATARDKLVGPPKCQHNNMEIDFRKYGKTNLATFKDELLLLQHHTRRKNSNSNSSNKMDDADEDDDDDVDERRHVILLYDYLELTSVLSYISEMYNLPLLHHADERKKGVRPEGTCDEELLDLFHDCFSSELMKLT